jgi:hypothetical protein
MNYARTLKLKGFQNKHSTYQILPQPARPINEKIKTILQRPRLASLRKMLTAIPVNQMLLWLTMNINWN